MGKGNSEGFAVGTLRVELTLHGVASLKEKRSVVRRVLSRVQNQFGVSAAEVGHLDLHQSALLGFAVVSNDARLANAVCDQIANFIRDLHLAEMGRAEIEILHL